MATASPGATSARRRRQGLDAVRVAVAETQSEWTTGRPPGRRRSDGPSRESVSKSGGRCAAVRRTIRPRVRGTSSAIAPPSRTAPVVSRRTGSSSPAQPARPRRSATADRPRRVELGGRLVEDQHARAHGDDAGDGDSLLLAARQRARFAIGEVADRQSRHACRRCAHPSPRAGRPGSPGRTRAPRGRSASMPDSWLAGVAKTIPTRPSSVASRSRVGASTPRPIDPAADLRLDHARDESGRRQGQRRLARAGPPGRPRPARRRPTVERHPVEASARAPRIADGQIVDAQGLGHRIDPVAGATERRPGPSRPRRPSAEPAVHRRVGHDAIGGPPGSRPESARLERQRPLADVDERAQQDRAR